MTTTCRVSFAGTHSRIQHAFHATLFSDNVPRPCRCLSTTHKDFKTSFGGRAAKPSRLTTITTTEWPNRLLPPTPGSAVLELLMTPRRVMSLPSPGSFLGQGARKKSGRDEEEKKQAQAQSSQMLFFSRFAGESQLLYRGSGPPLSPEEPHHLKPSSFGTEDPGIAPAPAEAATLSPAQPPSPTSKPSRPPCSKVKIGEPRGNRPSDTRSL